MGISRINVIASIQVPESSSLAIKNVDYQILKCLVIFKF